MPPTADCTGDIEAFAMYAGTSAASIHRSSPPPTSSPRSKLRPPSSWVRDPVRTGEVIALAGHG